MRGREAFDAIILSIHSSAFLKTSGEKVLREGLLFREFLPISSFVGKESSAQNTKGKPKRRALGARSVSPRAAVPKKKAKSAGAQPKSSAARVRKPVRKASVRRVKAAKGNLKKRSRRSVSPVSNGVSASAARFVSAPLFLAALLVGALTWRGTPGILDAPVSAVSPTWVSKEEASPRGLPARFKQNASRPIQDRIAYWSKGLAEEARAIKEPLRTVISGFEIADSAPLLPESDDCTTFVETVIALARSRGAEEFLGKLLAVRYRDGRPSFGNRNHFPEADWIPNNQRAGILSDITQEVALSAGVRTLIATKVIQKSAWLSEQLRKRKVGRELASSADSSWNTSSKVSIAVISLSDLDRVIDKLPGGAVINIVREDRPSRPVLITHQGFVIRERGEALLRHASSGGKIHSIPLRGYLEQLSASSRGGWKVIGINLNSVSL